MGTVCPAPSRADSSKALWTCALATAVVLLLTACNRKPSDVLVVSGRVEVDNIHIGSKIGGRVAKVAFEEGDPVKKGDVIVQLDDAELSAALAQARASVVQSQAQLNLILAGTREEDITKAEAVVSARRSELELRRKGFREEEIRQADAQLVSAQSELDLAKREFDRSTQLLKNNTIDRSEYERTRNTYETARAQMEVARQRATMMKTGSRPEEIAMAEAQLKQVEADLLRLKNGSRPEEIAASRAAVEAAAANQDRLASQLEETRITSPSNAQVETLDLEPGDLVKAGETIAVLNLPTQPWVRCYVPENQLSQVRAGNTVNLYMDSAPGKAFRGKIRRVNSEAEFTPRNVQTTEKRSELVFEMKVDVVEGGEQFRAGMYADVHVNKSR